MILAMDVLAVNYKQLGCKQALMLPFTANINGSNGYLRFDTRSSGTTAERMRIDSSGNVGKELQVVARQPSIAICQYVVTA